MADEFFKLLGRIEVDQDSLKKSLGESETLVRQWGEKNKRLWNEGITPNRVAEDDVRLKGQSVQVGGRNIRTDESVFTRAGQMALTAAKLHEGAKKAAEGAEEASGKVGKFASTMHHAAAQARNLSPILNRVAPGFGMIAQTALRAAPILAAVGVGIAGVGAAALIGAGLIYRYVAGQAAALKSSLELDSALRRQDWDGVAARIASATEELAKYADNAERAKRGGIQGNLAQLSDWWSRLSGAQEEATETLKKNKEAEPALFESSGKAALMRAAAEQEAIKVRMAGIAVDREAANTAEELIANTKRQITEIKNLTDAKRVALDKEYADIQRNDAGLSPETQAKKMQDVQKRLKALLDEGTQAQTAANKTNAKELAELEAQKEAYAQKDISRAQARIQSMASMAQAVIESERSIQEIRENQLGITESSTNLEKRLAQQRTIALTPLLTGIQAENEAYASQKRAIEALIAAGDSRGKHAAELAELEKSHSATLGEMERKRIQTTAALEAAAAAAREARNQKEIANEERRLNHAIAMGRASMVDQMAAAQAAITDPRRTLEQQEQAEKTLFETRKAYAENYFSLYKSLGQDVSEAELQNAEHLLAQLKSGSEQWFAQVKKVGDLIKGQQAEQEAYDQRARDRAEGKVKPGDRKKDWTVDSMGMVSTFSKGRPSAPGDGTTFARAPGADLAAAIGRASTAGPDETVRPEKAFASMAEKTSAAATAMDALTLAAEQAAGALQGIRGGGGSDDSSQAPSRPGRTLPTASGGRSVYTNMPQLDQFLGQGLEDSLKRSGGGE